MSDASISNGTVNLRIGTPLIHLFLTYSACLCGHHVLECTDEFRKRMAYMISFFCKLFLEVISSLGGKGICRLL
jgi:hypothetical protein